MKEAPRPDTGSSLAPCISVLGTGSDTGKSIMVAALCRIFSDLGVRVAPFKAQNMSNNSYVTPAGGEMGRAQVVQAEAARAALHTDMNPVLLKPCSDTGSQVVLHGKPMGNREAGEYFSDTGHLFSEARASLERLRAQYELVIMEGAGSCAEVNLRERDFVNFRMARAASAPVILIADIDRGGVFGQVVGTLEVLPEEDARCIRAVVINRFRGDAALFADGIEYLEKKTGLPVLGLIPFFRHIEIDAEDAVPLDMLVDPPGLPGPDATAIAVIKLPHVSNFTDFSPLERDTGTALHYLTRPRNLEGYRLVLLPGTKNVRGDLRWLKETGWTNKLLEYIRGGGMLGGLCGGYQILGRVVRDPHGVEGQPGDTPGLGLLDVETVLRKEKVLSRSSGIWQENGEDLEGYEIHMGETRLAPGARAPISVTSRDGKAAGGTDGAMSTDGKVWGTYFHGLFDAAGFRCAFLKALDPARRPAASGTPTPSAIAFRNRQYDLLAAHFREHLDMQRLLELTGLSGLPPGGQAA